MLMETPTLKELSKLIGKEDNLGSLSKRKIVVRKLSASIMLLLSDEIMLILSMLIAVAVRHTLWVGEINASSYLGAFPIIAMIVPLVFALRGLYPGYGKDVVYELRNITYSITIVFAILGMLSFLVKGNWEFSRLIFLFSWVISVITVPIGRSFIRHRCAKAEWWGVPVMIIGAGKPGEEVVKSLNEHKHLGLRPIVAVDDDSELWGYCNGVPVVGGLSTVPTLAKKLNIEHAIIVLPGSSRKYQREIIEKYSGCFEHTIVIPDIFGLSSIWVSSNEVGGIFGLEVQQKLLKIPPKIAKRIFDVTLATIIGLCAMPLIAVVAALIWIDSRGKGGILFRQSRVGINDTRFDILKFRTMRVDAEQRLNYILQCDPALREEYETHHKMQDDPRLTKIGKVLRKFSIDELPQFWNVIKGEMSLIGPRTYLIWERAQMEGNEDMILRVKPGISGFWQVTDHNGSTFKERMNKDIYYIRNWSMFLDLYILARTISVVFLGKGA